MSSTEISFRSGANAPNGTEANDGLADRRTRGKPEPRNSSTALATADLPTPASPTTHMPIPPRVRNSTIEPTTADRPTKDFIPPELALNPSVSIC